MSHGAIKEPRITNVSPNTNTIISASTVSSIGRSYNNLVRCSKITNQITRVMYYQMELDHVEDDKVFDENVKDWVDTIILNGNGDNTIAE